MFAFLRSNRRAQSLTMKQRTGLRPASEARAWLCGH